MAHHFEKQVAIITGAASGLGLAIARELSKYGVTLALLDKNKQVLVQVGDALPQPNETYALDITDEAQVKATVESVYERFGAIHILVNSAGIVGGTNIQSHQVDTEDLKAVMEVNYIGSFLTSKYSLPYMLDHGYGRVLHIASIAGKEGNAGMLAYSASKAAVIAMTKVQGKEYAETGITINALAPAVIQTAMVAEMPKEQVKYMTDKIPMKRCGTLSELVHMAIFIISKENSFSTGFTFDLSGGRATY